MEEEEDEAPEAQKEKDEGALQVSLYSGRGSAGTVSQLVGFVAR